MVIADLALPPPLERAEDISPLALDRNGEWLHAFSNSEKRWRFQADLDEIDPTFIERLITIEDKRFYNHAGVDTFAIIRACISSAKSGRVVSGASTITMQTARMLEPRPRTLPSKAIEMLRALQIERRLSKREILELYLTLTPYGGNLEGVRAASLSYLNKEPIRLTDAEQALLIALPQAPEARRPDLNPENAARARAEILRKLQNMGALDQKLAKEATEARLPSGRTTYPRLAYHAARKLTAETSIATTTLDVMTQDWAEALVQDYAAQLNDGATASLLVIENKTREVRASVGSSGLDVEGGWIDLTGAIRSPGSTLKPFIYAMAFDDGRLAPSTLIDDMPRAFGDYTPENFDRTFRGEVRAREALQHSLNLPAVAALSAVGARRFLASIDAAGVDLETKERAEKKAGLALALGGAGVTAQDLGLLYAGLADGGAMLPLKWVVQEGAQSDSYQLISTHSAEAIGAILSDAPSLEGRAPAKLSNSAPRVAFKTGTSYGYRDAWAAGYSGGYTVIAWVGRADGAARPGETGRKAAAPLLFDAFDRLAEMTEHENAAPAETLNDAPAIARLDRSRQLAPPEIIFPREGVEVFLSDDKRGFSLAARGGAGDLKWYVDGKHISGARALWHPQGPGFFDVTVVDAAGRSATAKVRVRKSI